PRPMRPIPTTPTRIGSARLRSSARYIGAYRLVRRAGQETKPGLRLDSPGVSHRTSEGGSCYAARKQESQVGLVASRVPENIWGGGRRPRLPRDNHRVRSPV